MNCSASVPSTTPFIPCASHPTSFPNALYEMLRYFGLWSNCGYLRILPASSSITAPASLQRNLSRYFWEASDLGLSFVFAMSRTASMASVVILLCSHVCHSLMLYLGVGVGSACISRSTLLLSFKSMVSQSCDISAGGPLLLSVFVFE